MKDSDRIHLELQVDESFKIVAISDCHGNLDILKKLIARLDLKATDYLVIVGDFLQKGPHNMDILRYMRELSTRPNTYILIGNHEYYILWLLEKENVAQFKRHLGSLWHECILDEWLEVLGEEFSGERALLQQEMIKDTFFEDLDFLRKLPITLKMDNFVFVHGGVDDDRYKEADFRKLLKRDEFYLEGHSLSEYVVCGHWPVGNYKDGTLCCDPILDHNKRIFAIDGGQGVKSYGQMNALVIKKKGKDYSYNWASEDNYDTVIATHDYEGLNETLVKLSWQSNRVKILSEDQRYYKVEKVTTGDVTRVPKMLVASDDEGHYVKRNWVNHYPRVTKGEFVKLIEVIDWLAMVKVRGTIGWIPVAYLDMKD